VVCRDKPDNWQDLVGRYEDSVEGLTKLVDETRKSK
jgi:hypothetical protein